MLSLTEHHETPCLSMSGVNCQRPRSARLEEIGYEDVAPEVLQECAALVHLVNRDMAVGLLCAERRHFS